MGLGVPARPSLGGLGGRDASSPQPQVPPCSPTSHLVARGGGGGVSLPPHLRQIYTAQSCGLVNLQHTGKGKR